MTKLNLIFAFAALTSTTAAFAIETPAVAQTSAAAMPVVGKMLYSTGGKMLAAVYKLDSNGAPQILLNGKLITIPTATLSDADGRVETTLTKKDLLSSH